MKTCLYYWIFEPIRGGLSDSPDRTPSIEQILKFENEDYEFRLYCDQENVPEFARVKFTGLSEENFSSSASDILQIVREHLISILKISYREDFQLFPHAIWTFLDAGQDETVNVLTEHTGSYRFNESLVKALFTNSLPMREELKLFVDGTDKRIPLQYRYLSFYKLLELKFRENGRWKQKELKAMLAQYQDSFNELNIKSEPYNYLHIIRNKCAHIRSGKNQMEFGVTHLNRLEIEKVSNLLPVIENVCRELINIDAIGKFGIGKRQTTETIHSNK